MVRMLLGFSVLVAALSVVSVQAGDAKKKKTADLSAFTGKITDVNVDEKSKKVESIYVEIRKNVRRTVNINEKTKIEFVGFPDKESEAFKVGQTAEVKMDFDANYASNIKVAAGPATKKKK